MRTASPFSNQLTQFSSPPTRTTSPALWTCRYNKGDDVNDDNDGGGSDNGNDDVDDHHLEKVSYSKNHFRAWSETFVGSNTEAQRRCWPLCFRIASTDGHAYIATKTTMMIILLSPLQSMENNIRWKQYGSTEAMLASLLLYCFH